VFPRLPFLSHPLPILSCLDVTSDLLLLHIPFSIPPFRGLSHVSTGLFYKVGFLMPWVLFPVQKRTFSPFRRFPHPRRFALGGRRFSFPKIGMRPLILFLFYSLFEFFWPIFLRITVAFTLPGRLTLQNCKMTHTRGFFARCFVPWQFCCQTFPPGESHRSTGALLFACYESLTRRRLLDKHYHLLSRNG